jgi:superfamily I DNA/RNA helicase
LQHTTDLYSNEFPDYTTIGQGIISDDHPQAEPPQIIYCNEATSLGRFVAKRVSDMRRENIRQIAVICHADSYWSSIEDELRKNRDLPLNVLRQRGENLDSDTPMVVLSRPGTIGGQEFDAVILVGLEQGVVPPVLRESPTLAGALEQQAYREMYVSITRARYRVLAVISPNASPTLILREAEKAGRITSHLQ